MITASSGKRPQKRLVQPSVRARIRTSDPAGGGSGRPGYRLCVARPTGRGRTPCRTGRRPRLSRRPLPALPEPGAALLAHLLNALADAVPGALGAALALLPGEGEHGGSRGACSGGSRRGSVVGDGPRWVAVPATGGGAARGLARGSTAPPVPRTPTAPPPRTQPVLACAVAVVEYCAGEEERAEQMVQMVQYRRVIEQAKGSSWPPPARRGCCVRDPGPGESAFQRATAQPRRGPGGARRRRAGRGARTIPRPSS